MPTRRLIGLALLCGLAILLAGGIQLLRLGRANDPQPLLRPGQPADVDGVTALLTSSELRDGTLSVRVEVTAGDAGLDDPTPGWAAVAPRGLVDRVVSTCTPDGALAARATTSCSLEFDSGDATVDELVVVFANGDRRASWVLTDAESLR